MLSKTVIQGLIDFRDDECGASAIEYGLFAALIAAVIAVTVGGLGRSINASLTSVQTEVFGPAPAKPVVP